MTLSGKDHERQAADRPPGGEDQPSAPTPSGAERRKSRIEEALATAQDMAKSAEQVILLCTTVSDMETNMALAAVKVARAMLYLAQIVLRSLLKNQH